jgi:predicted AlkP superfamily phosphohydrolase/phosphomutase
VAIPLKIYINSGEKSILLKFQGNTLSLKEDKWSNWQRIYFNLGLFKNAYGIVRFYLKSIQPQFELYMSPINFNPQRPPFFISYPHNYSKKLAKEIGLYYTQGMPHDTWALSENRIDEKVFLEHVDEILKEKERILKEELKGFKGGVFFFYLDTLDAIQHMFWRYLDPNHPLYERNALYKDTIFKYYETIDQLIGDILKNLDTNTTLILLSDHGFSSFRRSVHLNRWLLENGYLFLKPGVKESEEFFESVDWSKTIAYALGFGGIYLNRIGREYYGMVIKSDVQNIKNTIARGLRDFKDPQNGEKVVNNVYFNEEAFKGPYINDAPDLFVGFNRGYRASWQTALGGVPKLLIEDNVKKWSGDHLVDSFLVPGVIFMNKREELNNPSIVDIVPTILYLFDIDKPNDMEGKSLFKNEVK